MRMGMFLCLIFGLPCAVALSGCGSGGNQAVQAAGIRWQHLTSKNGDLPVPGQSTQQTGSIVADLDKNAQNDFVLSFRQKGPALVWYRRSAQGWKRYVIEKKYLTVESGGAVYDIDGDGDPDLVFGGDYQTNKVWWWQNPYPKYKPEVSWKRHLIKSSGYDKQHDQIFGDFEGTGKPQLVFWNQKAHTLFLAHIPKHPRLAKAWPRVAIFSAGISREHTFDHAEGLAKADIDGDGRLDLLGDNHWFKYLGGDRFKAIQIADHGGRIAAGQLDKGGHPEVVISSGDEDGPLTWYECIGDAQNPKAWAGHVLVKDVVHGHSLQIADIDGDGNLDIFAGEMGAWQKNGKLIKNPNPKAWIFYGDGTGHFRKTTFATGIGFHDAQVADLDGDGDLDILDAPYTLDTPRVDVWLQNTTATKISLKGSFKGPLGLEFYSLRHRFKKHPLATVRTVHDLGFTNAEGYAYGYPPSKWVKLLHLHGIKLLSTNAPYTKLRDDIGGVIANAKALGVHYVICGWIPHKGRFNAADARKAAVVFNAAGKQLTAAGFRFAYHPHGYEFVPAPGGYDTLFDLIAAKTKPQWVAFELDTMWATLGGANPVDLLHKYGPRFELMHLKDLKKGVPVNHTGTAPDADSVVVGQGQIDWPAVLRAAKRAGVKHYFIEDESRDAIDQIPKSVRYLEQVSW